MRLQYLVESIRSMGGKRNALIFGVSGQDGSYLAEMLLRKGYSVWGTSRNCKTSNFENLRRLGIFERIYLRPARLGDLHSVKRVIALSRPHEIYNLAAQSSVGLSFDQPIETIEASVNGTANILEAMRLSKLDARFYNASSGEIFGNTASGCADEETPFRPCSPYGIAKAAASWLVTNYRDAYGLFACSGIMFNHESPLRPARFVTQKIVRGAFDIARGNAEVLSLGNLAISRDWGWAPEYVDAMWRMLQQDRPDDYVIATGKMHSLEEFVDRTFASFGLDWKRCVRTAPGLLRPLDVAASCGDPGKARRNLAWEPRIDFYAVVANLVSAEIERRSREPAASGDSPA